MGRFMDVRISRLRVRCFIEMSTYLSYPLYQLIGTVFCIEAFDRLLAFTSLMWIAPWIAQGGYVVFLEVYAKP